MHLKVESTDFDLLDAVKRNSARHSLSYLKQQHKIVAEEILHELGELSIHSSQSEEDKLLISKFSRQYFRVVTKFKPYNNNFKKPGIGKQFDWNNKIERLVKKALKKAHLRKFLTNITSSSGKTSM